mmetsp:Transcript_17654/g.29980  ORF Transcript_17654/g.29980 Transcript_17654/m.29980 type:complete len:294 (-) Transcript_17654:196-1077(-)
MTVSAEKYAATLLACKKHVRDFINEQNCHPIMVRLAWHDSGTYCARMKKWGADGSIRFKEELAHGANAGLAKAMSFVEGFKKKFPELSYADIIQMASAEAISLAGGPEIKMRYGRKDAEQAAVDGHLPAAMPPFPSGGDAAGHLRAVFGRMGFSDRDIVALSGAHTIGRAFKGRSGVTDCGFGKAGTRYTSNENHCARNDGKKGLGMLGGKSWTKNWISFDNSYFKEKPCPDLLLLPTDDAVRRDPSFRPHFERYARSQYEFFADYAAAHQRLSELGSTFVYPGGVVIPDSRL